MKKILLLFIVLLTLTSFNAFDKPAEFNIVGKWESEDETGEIGYLNFDEDKYAYIQLGDMIMGGKEFVENGKKGSMTYSIDYTKKPIQLDFIVHLLDINETRKLLGIINVVSKNKIEITLGFNGERPVGFNTSDTMVFKRIDK